MLSRFTVTQLKNYRLYSVVTSGYSVSRKWREQRWKGQTLSQRLQETFDACTQLIHFAKSQKDYSSSKKKIPGTSFVIEPPGGLPADPDVILDFLSFLRSNGMRAVIGGSIAGFCYAYPRATRDVDLLLDLSDEKDFEELRTVVMQNSPDIEFIQEPISVGIRSNDDKEMVAVAAAVMYKGSPFELFMNTWWGTEHALAHNKTAELSGKGIKEVEIIPPESYCFFRASSLNRKAHNYYQHVQDLLNVLRCTPQLGSINEYVRDNLVKHWGGDHFAVRKWDRLVQEAKDHQSDVESN